MPRGKPRTRVALYREIDFERLDKGMTLEAPLLQRALETTTDRKEYFHLLLGLGAQIEKMRGILCRIDGTALRLMTDAEAVVWNVKQAEAASRKLDLAAERLRTRIDRTQLSETQAMVHEHATRVVTAMAEAQRREREKAGRLMSVLSPTTRLKEST